jgi:hypothetical protein
MRGRERTGVGEIRVENSEEPRDRRLVRIGGLAFGDDLNGGIQRS